MLVDAGPLAGFTVPVRDDGSFDPDSGDAVAVDVHCEDGAFVADGFSS